MTPDEIKAEIIKKGFSLTMIADVLGKSPSMVSKVVNGSATSLLIADCISRILDRPIHEVFPNLYDESFAKTYKTSKSYKAKKEELKELLRR
ncbi:helix-turn-helix domain-containing protein [Pseudidiomarina terrestris]|uniref:helix-turn-helix domain-containing protein n=1 Tax=Pseudidiomarina terrestris TaxID=2820060 RepID=UPI00264FA80D|nr:helix-turn-helix domain-containing protein [Pseudidiomarina sp. 1ASP75-5]MDN7136388.1 helix-turn-helix domain-containing protein [Pseudidiomarina sp. 1ASP75-5]